MWRMWYEKAVVKWRGEDKDACGQRRSNADMYPCFGPLRRSRFFYVSPRKHSHCDHSHYIEPTARSRPRRYIPMMSVCYIICASYGLGTTCV
jgi:hypothetical protein